MAVKSSGPVLSEAARVAMSDPDIVGPQLDALLEGAEDDPLVLSHLGTGADPVVEGATPDEQQEERPPTGGDPKEGESEEEEGGEEEAGAKEEGSSEGTPPAKTGEEEAEPEEEPAEEGAAKGEGEGELSESELKLRQTEAENAALKALLEGGDIELDTPAPPTTPSTPSEPAPVVEAQPTPVVELSAEEHAEILSDPAKMQTYMQNHVAMAEQRAMAIVPSVVQDLMRTEREVGKFFTDPTNSDISSDALQQYVTKIAAKLQGAGPNVTVTAALEAAADKVREKVGLPKKTTTPKKKIASGAKKTSKKGKGGAKRFASPTSRRATSASGEGDEKSSLQKQLDILDTDE